MDKLAEIIAGLAQQLGLEAARIWPQMVLATWSMAAAELFIWFVWQIFLSASMVGVHKLIWDDFHRNNEAGEYGYETYYSNSRAVSLGFFIVFGILTVGGLCVLPGIVSHLAAPEAWTVKELLVK